ncbi:hypothetical protein TELCIR_08219 [Teladorsagia circumcincta]|uniref:Uncharacterized protein n=1 Tax=Teladorsagia circumcincta TaxID=45464 RepID=A0A2G9UI67_TELCI|nr:hypothetical protein TELCIR_08219 [Teladorsagia circumcincta]
MFHLEVVRANIDDDSPQADDVAIRLGRKHMYRLGQWASGRVSPISPIKSTTLICKACICAKPGNRRGGPGASNKSWHIEGCVCAFRCCGNLRGEDRPRPVRRAVERVDSLRETVLRRGSQLRRFTISSHLDKNPEA